MICYKCKSRKNISVNRVSVFPGGGAFFVRFFCDKCRFYLDTIFKDEYVVGVNSRRTPAYSKQALRKIKYYQDQVIN